MSADIEFNLVNSKCMAGNGHQWSQIWTRRPSGRNLRHLVYLGKKQLPAIEEGLLDHITEKIDRSQHAFIGGIAIFRLCEGVTHGRVPRLEKVAAYAVAHSVSQEPLPMAAVHKPQTKDGWGSAKVNLPGAGTVENVIYLPHTPSEADSSPYTSLLMAGAQQQQPPTYVAWSGAEELVLPSPFMLKAAQG